MREDSSNTANGTTGGSGDARPSPARSAATFGMWLFLAALFVLFAASLFGYVVMRSKARRHGFGAGAVHLPGLLWLSTAAVIGVSVALGRAMAAFRKARQRAFRNALTAALALAAGFVTIQAPALVALLVSNAAVRRAAAEAAATRPAETAQFAPPGTALYALVFFLVLVHALHVLGGIVALWRLTIRAHRGNSDPIDLRPLRHVTMYWHFLDAVWVVMFLTFLLTR